MLKLTHIDVSKHCLLIAFVLVLVDNQELWYFYNIVQNILTRERFTGIMISYSISSLRIMYSFLLYVTCALLTDLYSTAKTKSKVVITKS